MTLVEKLEKIQIERGLSDRAFAKELGISHSLWSRVRAGEVPCRFEILSRVVRVFPALQMDVLIYLQTVEGRGKRQKAVA